MLTGGAEPVQIGAFLMLRRYKRETPAELAGFLRAARELAAVPDAAAMVDLDWPSYAFGRTRGAPGLSSPSAARSRSAERWPEATPIR